MRSLLDSARHIFEVAEAASDAEPQDFALIIKPDGALHFVMESAFTIDGASQDTGAESAFRVTRSATGVRVEGHGYGTTRAQTCVIQKRNVPAELLRDRPLYSISEPSLLPASPCENAVAG